MWARIFLSWTVWLDHHSPFLGSGGLSAGEKSIQDVVKGEKARLKKNRRSVWQVTKDSRASLSFYRLGAYAILIMGFFYLDNIEMMNIPSYLTALALPPIIVVITLMNQRNN